jgi:hypothetical protein
LTSYLNIDGGTTAEGSISCSGGARDDDCFSARFMWRTKGAMELYTYLPPSHAENQGVCDIPPFSECNPKYGASVGRGAATFATGKWNTIAQRVRLNDFGKANGEIEVFANQKSLFTATGLVLITDKGGAIQGIQAQTFFGGASPPLYFSLVVLWTYLLMLSVPPFFWSFVGSTSAWASPKDQDAYFADFSTAILEYK